MARTQVDHYIPFFGRDFYASTAMWTAEEVGHYIRLLVIQWDSGGLPSDLDRLELVSPGVSKVWPLLSGKFPACDDGFRRNARMEEHRARATELKDARSEAGQEGNRRRWGDRKRIANGSQTDRKAIASGIAKGIAKVSPPSPSPSPSSSSLRSEEIIPPHAAAEAREPWMGHALDRWVPFREQWNQTPGAAVWNPLNPPTGSAWLECISNGSWREQYPLALAKLAGLRRFKNPVTLTQFLSDGWVGRIVAGDFDGEPVQVTRHKQARPAESNF